MILVNPKDKKILYNIAYLHQNYINKGFLSTLGTDFLFCIYKSISLSPNSFLAVALENDKVIGFVSGTKEMSELKKNLIKICKLKLLKTFLKLIFNPYKLFKLLETYKYSSNKYFHSDINEELLSIVVDAECRGKSTAKQLYEFLCLWFKQNNVLQFKIIVGKDLNRAQRFYEKMGAKRIGEIQIHRGDISYVYVQKLD